jgi:hypothetical protein
MAAYFLIGALICIGSRNMLNANQGFNAAMASFFLFFLWPFVVLMVFIRGILTGDL